MWQLMCYYCSVLRRLYCLNRMFALIECFASFAYIISLVSDMCDMSVIHKLLLILAKIKQTLPKIVFAFTYS